MAENGKRIAVPVSGRRVAIGLVFVALCSAPLARAQTTPPPSTQPPTLRLGVNEIAVEGLTPDGSTVIFGLARRSHSYWQTLERYAEIVTADGTGVAHWDAEETIPWKSVWFIVDLASGEFTSGVPEGFVSDEIDFPGRGIGAALNVLDSEGESKEFLWVRPTVGAWTLTALDGGRNDGDGATDRNIRADVSKFRPLGSSPVPPDRFAPGDVLVGIDYRSLTFYAARLAR